MSEPFFLYYPITDYHVILCYLFRKYYGQAPHKLILDKNLLRPETFSRLEFSAGWDQIFVVKDLPAIPKFIDRNVLFRSNYSEVFNFEDGNFISFSFGADFSNNIVNNLYRSNIISLAEDGVFPYYGLEAIESYFKNLPHERVDVKLKRFLLRHLNHNNLIDLSKINKLLVMKPQWLPQEVLNQFEVEGIDTAKVDILSIFEELSSLYKYENESLKSQDNIDFVLFDSGLSLTGIISESAENRVLCSFFEKICNKKVYVKLRAASDDSMQKRSAFFRSIQANSSCEMIIDVKESKFPWEIIYFNNRARLKDAAFVCINFTTAFYSSNIFFNDKNNMICLCNLLPNIVVSEVHSLKAFAERINRDVTTGTVFFPRNLPEFANCFNT